MIQLAATGTADVISCIPFNSAWTEFTAEPLTNFLNLGNWFLFEKLETKGATIISTVECLTGKELSWLPPIIPGTVLVPGCVGLGYAICQFAKSTLCSSNTELILPNFHHMTVPGFGGVIEDSNNLDLDLSWEDLWNAFTTYKVTFEQEGFLVADDQAVRERLKPSAIAFALAMLSFCASNPQAMTCLEVEESEENKDEVSEESEVSKILDFYSKALLSMKDLA